MLLIAIAVWLLVSVQIRPFLLGTVLAWSVFVRPQVIPDVVMITGYVMVEYGALVLLRYAAAGALWTIPTATMMRVMTGGFFSPFYGPGMLDLGHQFWRRLDGLLLSASRGLLVFVPVVLVPLYLTIRYWRYLPRRRLAVLALIIITLHLSMLSCWEAWWGGGSYGPRILLEVMPWFVLLGILSIKAFLEDRTLNGRQWAVTVSIAVLLLIASIAMNAPGALSQNSIGWRRFDPQHLSVLWDWHDPQFLCWWR